MDDSILGAKDLYDVVLKTTCDTTINGRLYEDGEVLCRFDKIQIANISENRQYRYARGGNGNRELICWDESQVLRIQFNQGVFSKTQLSVLTNSKMAQQMPQENVLIPYHEELETNELCQVTLKKNPTYEKLFVYTKEGEKILNYEIVNNVLTFSEPYQEVIIDYYSLYNNNSTSYSIGLPLTNGFLRLEGRTRLKDDITGHIVTGILIIPKLKLKTGLSVQVGAASVPMVGTFHGEGYPTGKKGHTPIGQLIILSDDTDSDI